MNTNESQMKYDSKIVEFMRSWNLSVEENDSRLEKLAKGELVRILVGCDSAKRSIMNCSTEHAQYRTQSQSGWITKCEICEKALHSLEIFNVYSIELEKIIFVMESKQVEEEILQARKIVDSEHDLNARNIARETQRKKTEQGNRTIVSVEKNEETGMWKIIGGENSRLERSVFFAALNEMNDAFSDARKTNSQTLATMTQPDGKKYFDLLTANFAYKIVNVTFDE
jgi:hypothetical protein